MKNPDASLIWRIRVLFVIYRSPANLDAQFLPFAIWTAFSQELLGHVEDGRNAMKRQGRIGCIGVLWCCILCIFCCVQLLTHQMVKYGRFW